MKTTSIVLVAFILLSAVGCKKKIEGELGEPFDKVKGMTGTWELISFSQTDVNNPIQEKRDLSKFYIKDGVTPLQLTFNGSDRSYETSISFGKNYFGEGGVWAFDDEEYPSYLMLYSDTDTLQFNLGSIVREFDQTMSIELPRGCNLGTSSAQPTVIYTFEFTRLAE
ncbi:MAG: hypothetical protein RL226_310 [Bacteroidota bacterium]|jgi:hypothetical protein